MTPFRPFSGHAQVYFVLFATSVLAALQNVTVDDAVLTGSVVPQYFPSLSAWNIGNECTVCFVKPDPALVYNGTWHDSTYDPNSGFTQAIEFTFTGSALYIFFIIANNVTGATTLTDVEFVLDDDTVSRYTHAPLATTDYQYNVPVFANGSLTPGQHSMMIQPVDSGNQVLMLFDYFIYTMDTSSSVSSSASATSTSDSPPSVTSSGTQATSSRQNIGAIVGGTVGGVAALALVIASLLCYRRYKRHNSDPPSEREEAVLEPFMSSPEVAPTTFVNTISSTRPTVYSPAEPTFGSKTGAYSVALQPSIPPPSTTGSSSSGAAYSNNAGLLEQVEQLRDEVARLRHLQNQDQNSIDLQSELPPEYS